MTTYTRALSAQHIETLRLVIHRATSEGCPGVSPRELVEAGDALAAPVNGEALCMPVVCDVWEQRARELGLPKKGERRERDREAYMQGALAVLVAAGMMTQGRAGQLAFMTAVCRLPEYMDAQSAKYAAQECARLAAETAQTALPLEAQA